jgi:putative hydrolase of the HAD superfamily
MRLSAVAFDLDDTLATVGRDRATLLGEALAAAGADGADVGRADYLAAHGEHDDADTREPLFETLLAGHDADPAVAARAYREATAAAIEPVAGADDLLATLRERYAVGLLTDGPGRAQRDKLDALGWAGERDGGEDDATTSPGDGPFDATVVTGDLRTRKPDPAAFAALLDALGVAPAAAVYVGDHPERDVGGAAAAGLRTVQVLGPAETAHPRADAAVARSALAERLPGVLASL